MVTVFILIIFSTASWATIFFKEGFESEITSKPDPVWSWKAPYSPSNPFGMMYGKGDIYTRSTTIVHSGKYSLRLNFAGRNGY